MWGPRWIGLSHVAPEQIWLPEGWTGFTFYIHMQQWQCAFPKWQPCLFLKTSHCLTLSYEMLPDMHYGQKYVETWPSRRYNICGSSPHCCHKVARTPLSRTSSLSVLTSWFPFTGTKLCAYHKTVPAWRCTCSQSEAYKEMAYVSGNKCILYQWAVQFSHREPELAMSWVCMSRDV